jgi:hypothetical protein
MTTLNLPRLLAAFTLAAGVAGCYVPTPVGHTTLRIAANGEYTFNGQKLAPANLERSIRAVQPKTGSVLVQFEVAPTASVLAVQVAVAAARAAKARVAFAGRNDTP